MELNAPEKKGGKIHTHCILYIPTDDAFVDFGMFML